MTEERPLPKYKKGDVVQVVDEPYVDCPFEWIGEMDECCGRVATITGVSWNEWHKDWGYSIDIDDYLCTWCENCFVAFTDIEESDVDINTLFQVGVE